MENIQKELRALTRQALVKYVAGGSNKNLACEPNSIHQRIQNKEQLKRLTGK